MDAQAQAVQDAKERKDKQAKLDFKMVTFALAGKDYGIDIMGVKEIAKANRFTYVPNAAPFVRGVYNLRGEIISVIDLRTMFHLPAERKAEDALESLLILQVADHVFGVIVDSIDKVVGVSSETIQPPHPIFGDINVKYIHGVVENQGRLYIILDIAKIFAPREERKAEDARALSGVETAPGAVAMAAAAQAGPADEAGMDLAFIRETLATFRRFGDSPINREWTAARFSSWKTARKGKDLQLKEAADADAFLEGFLSPHTAELWGREYLEDFIASLPDLSTKSVSAWNLGCGRGFETYSLAVALRRRYPEARIKVWANDADLLNISMAPNMVIQPGEAPEVYREYLQPGRNGLVFTAAIRDSISFEYHDVLNANPVPEVDLIVCRDTLSFMTADEQSRILADFRDKLKPGGRVFLGANEDLSGLEGWKAAPNAKLRCFTAED